jgi:hypothetical protein
LRNVGYRIHDAFAFYLISPNPASIYIYIYLPAQPDYSDDQRQISFVDIRFFLRGIIASLSPGAGDNENC